MQCVERGVATLCGLTVQRDDPRERARYNTVPLTFARGAPLSPTSVTMGAPSAHGPIAYAFDAATRRVHLRARDGERWTPWRALATELPPGARSPGAGSAPSTAVPRGARRRPHDSSPVERRAQPRRRRQQQQHDAAGAGARGAAIDRGHRQRHRPHRALCARRGGHGVRREQGRRRSGTAGWSEWFELGRVPGAEHIAAASPRGASTAARAHPRRLDARRRAHRLVEDRLRPRRLGAADEPLPALHRRGAGAPRRSPRELDAARQPVVHRVTDEGAHPCAERLVDGSAWTDEAPLPPPARRRPLGPRQRARSATGAPSSWPCPRRRRRALTGEVVAITEDDTPRGGFARARWRRFYR